jgi:hypothetical protein
MLQDPLTYTDEQRAEMARRVDRAIAEVAEEKRLYPLLGPDPYAAKRNGVGWVMTDRGTICVHLLDAYATV